MNSHTSTIITLSTSHITEATLEWLGSDPAIPMASDEHGYYLFSADLDDFEDVPADLLSVAQWCRCNGISYIRFERGEEPLDCLPVYQREYAHN